LRAHLAGKIALGFTVLEGARATSHALFGGFDLDVAGDERRAALHAAALELESRVGPLVDALFATTGSAPGRAKVILTLERPMPASTVRLAMRALLQHAQRRAEFATELHQFETFPKESSGGLLRILGRHINRRGPIEQPLAIADGSLTDLAGVVPASSSTIETLADIMRGNTRIDTFDRIAAERWSYKDMDTRAIYARTMALARAAIKRFGAERGEGEFFAAAHAIRSRSLALNEPSPKNRDRRNPLRDDVLENAWENVVLSPLTFQRKRLIGAGITPSAIRVYEALCAYVEAFELHPRLFEMDYARVADIAGFAHKMQALRAVDAAERHELLVRVDRGRATSRERGGPQGLMTLYALLGEGDTAADVMSRIAANPRLLARFRARQDAIAAESAAAAPKRETSRKHA
jgi:hypothetical protein